MNTVQISVRSVGFDSWAEKNLQNDLIQQEKVFEASGVFFIYNSFSGVCLCLCEEIRLWKTLNYFTQSGSFQTPERSQRKYAVSQR